MSTTFTCTGNEGCGEKIELPLHHIRARHEAYRRGWRFRGADNGLIWFCPTHTPPPPRHYG